MRFSRVSFFQGGLFYYLISFLFAYITIMTIIHYSNSGVKRILVKEKNLSASGRYKKNVVIDGNGNVYTVSNDFLMMHYTSTELYGSMEVGKSYTIQSYGLRIPFLGIYPNIVRATPA